MGEFALSTSDLALLERWITERDANTRVAAEIVEIREGEAASVVLYIR